MVHGSRRSLRNRLPLNVENGAVHSIGHEQTVKENVGGWFFRGRYGLPDARKNMDFALWE